MIDVVGVEGVSLLLNMLNGMVLAFDGFVGLFEGCGGLCQSGL